MGPPLTLRPIILFYTAISPPSLASAALLTFSVQEFTNWPAPALCQACTVRTRFILPMEHSRSTVPLPIPGFSTQRALWLFLTATLQAHHATSGGRSRAPRHSLRAD